jgi:hypothetical protein
MAERQIVVQANWLLGKKIVGVESVTYDNRVHNGKKQQEFCALTLDDGSRLVFRAVRSNIDPFVTASYTPGPGKGRRRLKPPKPPV